MTSLHQVYPNTFAPYPSNVTELDTANWRWTQWLGADSTAMIRRPDGAILMFCGDTLTTSVPNGYAFTVSGFTNSSLLYSIGGRFGVEYANGTGIFDSPGTNIFGAPNSYLPPKLNPGGFRWPNTAWLDTGTDGKVHLMATEFEGNIFTSYAPVGLREYTINQDLTKNSGASVPGLAPQISPSLSATCGTTVTSSIAASGTTSFTIASATGWPYGVGPFYVVVEGGTANEEIIQVTRSASSNPTTINIYATPSLSSSRGQYGTTAVTHALGSAIYPAYPITWGNAVIVDYATNFTYIFGTYQVYLDGTRVVVCRRGIMSGSLPGNVPNFWNGSTWSADMQDVVALETGDPLDPLVTPGSTYSVIEHPSGGYMLTSCRKGLYTNKIAAWYSTTVNGTWTDLGDIYTIPNEFTGQYNYGGLSYITDNNKLRLMYNLNGPGLDIDYRRYGIRWAEVEIPKAVLPFSATGGTTTDSGGYRYHTFNSSGNFVVTGSKSMDFLVVGGGGSGGGGDSDPFDGDNLRGGGGGGAGRFTTSTTNITGGTYVVTVGGGGAATNNGSSGNTGTTSSFSSTTALGGGGGDKGNYPDSGGSGGSSTFAGGATVLNKYGGSGGGGTSAVGAAPTTAENGANGGAGSTWNSFKSFGGGGGGGGGGNTTSLTTSTSGTGGTTGGGTGGYFNNSTNPNATAGTANTGGGGGGQNSTGTSFNGAGGSGVIIVRYLL